MVMRLLDTVGSDCLNNRYHDPITGQFISVDPLVTTTGQPYIYGAANPATLSDPLGLCAWDQWDCDAPTNDWGRPDGTSSGGWVGCHASGWGVGSQPGCPMPDRGSEAARSPQDDVIRDIVAAAGRLDATGAGSCVSASAVFLVGLQGSSCTVELSEVDLRAWVLSFGGRLSTNASASVTLDTLITNAERVDQLEGASLCFAVSGGGVGVAGGGVCGGLDSGGDFTGVVSVFAGGGIGAGALPLEGSVSLVHSWAGVMRLWEPKSYLSSDGSCVNGGNAGWCGQGSMNGAGVPTTPWP